MHGSMVVAQSPHHAKRMGRWSEPIMLPEEMHGSSASDKLSVSEALVLYVQPRGHFVHTKCFPAPAIFRFYYTSRAWASVFDITNISVMLSLEAVPRLEI